jgi:glycosyltransferase involved in cell wall biosynthesis
MPPLPLVSLVTPAYNQGAFLRETMLSVLGQDYPALEYVVIDDGSDDDTLRIAHEVAAAHPGRVTVLTQANAGQAAALNRTWASCHGEILGYLSSDDVLLPGAVTAMVAALQAAPDAAVAYCDYWLIDPSGVRLRAVSTPDFNRRDMLEDLVCAPGVGALFRRAVFTATGGWDVRRRQVPDFEFWLRAAEHGEFVRVPQRLAEYRVHEGSASLKVMPMARADEIVEMVQAYWAARPQAPAGQARRSVARAYSLSAKNHAQSARAGLALKRSLTAIRMRPGLLVDPSTWRQLLVGFVRRAYFGRLAKGRER